ncbi:metallophosphoesterase family protein [Sunxiuqinia sp. sy24]|uniref:metallophosphoesterase family protein n=1 Tax=Sunxiuqinia sp. sy24 TaxID=3461495 RepID=UPI004045A9ED
MSNTADIQIAFMADVHLLDIYGEFQDSEYAGVYNPATGKYTLARTMESQLHSTRLFNENYFAFLAALDDVVKRGVKLVVLPGDFSDDGQPVNVRGLKRILDDYSETYGIQFIVTTGNHDPVRPFSMEAGKPDFLGDGGKEQAIMSSTSFYKTQSSDALPAVITRDIRNMGYHEVIEVLSDFGFFPKQDDWYWETPFTTYSYDEYQFEQANQQAALEKRMYAIPPTNTTIPDVSYLVEPTKGLWFLALDANVYIPNEKSAADPENPLYYNGASNGYDNVLTHKKHLIDWVKRVVAEAETRGKTLVVFSHYPMIDFNDDASASIAELLGEGKMQLHRVPEENVAQIFADAGIKVHFGGHMHINDTGIRNSDKGNTLVNVQIPSLAAYIPAYKLLTLKTDRVMEVQTIVVDSVPSFKELFPLYEMEHAYLEKEASENVWNNEILRSENYKAFTSWHLKELVRLRFLPKNWPEELRSFLLTASGKMLLGDADSAVVNAPQFRTDEFELLTGFDLVYDFYRLRSADQLAIKDIGVDRIDQYQLLLGAWEQNLSNSKRNDQLKLLGEIFQHFLNGAPADHFSIDLQNSNLINLKGD